MFSSAAAAAAAQRGLEQVDVPLLWKPVSTRIKTHPIAGELNAIIHIKLPAHSSSSVLQQF